MNINIRKMEGYVLVFIGDKGWIEEVGLEYELSVIEVVVEAKVG